MIEGTKFENMIRGTSRGCMIRAGIKDREIGNVVIPLSMMTGRGCASWKPIA